MTISMLPAPPLRDVLDDEEVLAGLHDPRLARRIRREPPELLDVARLGDEERRHAPLERELAHGPVDMRERDDRPMRPETRDGVGRPPGEGRDEDRLRLQRL